MAEARLVICWLPSIQAVTDACLQERVVRGWIVQQSST